MSKQKLLTLATLASTLILAACGSSGKPRSPAANHFLAFAECMRTHGVPSFPDPASGGGIELSSGMNPFSPAFRAAQASCRKLLPGGGPPQHASEAALKATVRISQCMRTHGVSGFPDPTTKPPSNPAGYSLLEDRGGVVLAVPSTIDPQSPIFKAAAAACGFS